jgi:uncharacterized protein
VTTPDLALELARCEACKSRFLPPEGRCPRCGSGRVEPYTAPPDGTVIAASELVYPPPGWAPPHRLALVEVADGVRLLGVVDGSLPALGAPVVVRRDGAIYRFRPSAPRP